VTVATQPQLSKCVLGQSPVVVMVSAWEVRRPQEPSSAFVLRVGEAPTALKGDSVLFRFRVFSQGIL
jgi:hypothetical protein